MIFLYYAPLCFAKFLNSRLNSTLSKAFTKSMKYSTVSFFRFNLLERAVFSIVTLSIVPTFGRNPYYNGSILSRRLLLIRSYITFDRIFITCGIKAIVLCSSHFSVLLFFAIGTNCVSSHSSGISSPLYIL